MSANSGRNSSNRNISRNTNNTGGINSSKNNNFNDQGIKLGLSSREFDFLWHAKNSEGLLVNGEIRAKNQEEALKDLRNQKLFSIELKKIRSVKSRSITKKDIAQFFRQLATLLKAGLPLLQSMDIMAKGHENSSFSKLVNDIKLNVQSGSSLANALRGHPKYFDTLASNLIDAGEQAGVLDSMLDRIASYQEKNIAMMSKLKKAMIYPAFIISIVFIVIAIMMVFIIPTFKDIFNNFGAELPGPTLLVISISNFFVKNILWILLAPIVIFFGAKFLLRKSPKFRQLRDNFILKMPIIGSIIRKATISRWTRTLSTMFSSGIPIVESLDSVGQSSGNINYSNATKNIKQDVIKGTSLNTAMRSTQLFPNMVTQMVSSGEESGSLDTMLNKVSEFYEEEVDASIASLSTLIEPIIIVVLGVVICLILIAIYLPFFSIGKVF